MKNVKIDKLYCNIGFPQFSIIKKNYLIQRVEPNTVNFKASF